MAGYVCPWWAACFTIDIPLRKFVHDPLRIVGPYLKHGMTVLDVGCGVGWFSIPMAEMVGEDGKVIAVDLQQEMLDILGRRAERTVLGRRIRLHKCDQNHLGIDANIDFALVFAMLHEVPDQERMLGEIKDSLKPEGKLLLAEPPIHVSKKAFDNEVVVAQKVGFKLVEFPKVRWSHAVLLAKQ